MLADSPQGKILGAASVALAHFAILRPDADPIRIRLGVAQAGPLAANGRSALLRWTSAAKDERCLPIADMDKPG